MRFHSYELKPDSINSKSLLSSRNDMKNSTYLLLNREQHLRCLLGQRPLLCHNKMPWCIGCAPGQIFKCEGCKRLVPWCMGASDDYTELCDDCVPVLTN